MNDVTKEIAMRLVERLKLAGPIPMRLELYNLCGRLSFRLTMEVPDRDTGRQTKVTLYRDIPLHLRDCKPEDQSRLLVDMAYDMVRDGYIHEAEECFVLGGIRINDPHVEGISASRASMYETASAELLAAAVSPRT